MKHIAILWLLLAIGCSKTEPKPNILLILTDDQGYGDVALHGNPYLSTPNMDRIAMEGIRMDRFLVSSVCAPTRASLLTGRYSLRAGTQWVTRGLESMHPDETTFAQIFKQNGYRTALFGKWHNGAHFPNTPNGKGFDLFFGFNEGHISNYFDTDVEYQGETVSTNGYLTDVLTDSTLAFISRDQDQPFFAYLSIHTPHSPFQVPDAHFDHHASTALSDKDASVYGMVENIDINIGRILARLDELGLTENTIVIFMTDNGPNGERFNAGMRGIKASVHEGGLRVPFFIRWPKHIPAGFVRDHIAAHVDLVPTLVELSGVTWTPSKPLDGRSFASVLTDASASWPERLLFSHHSQNTALTPYPGAVRTDRYRAVNNGNGWALYDMLTDSSETTDIAHVDPETILNLAKAYDAWFEDVTRDLPASRPIPVGHTSVQTVTLPAPEAQFSGTVGFAFDSGWAQDWLTGFHSTEDAAWWDLDVIASSISDVWVRYTAEGAEVAELRVEAGSCALTATLPGGADVGFVPSPDRVPRGEAYEKARWYLARVGRCEVTQDVTRLSVGVVGSGDTKVEIHSIQLRRP